MNTDGLRKCFPCGFLGSLSPKTSPSPSPQPGPQEGKQSQTWEKKAQTIMKYLPSLGICSGIVLGLMSRESLSYQSRAACRAGFSGQPLLQFINGWKHLETQNIVYLTPLVVPLLAHGVLHFSKVKPKAAIVPDSLPKEESKEKQVTRSVVDKKSWAKTGHIALLAGLGLANSVFSSACKRISPSFNLSEHVLIKVVAASILSESAQGLSQKVSKIGQAVLLGYTALYAVSDAVLLYNTAAHCHTAYEVIAGLVTGAGLVALSQVLYNRVVASKKVAAH